MRDILFRAKGRDGEGWREGYYWRTNETTYCFTGDYKKFPDNTKHYLLFDEMTDWGLPNHKYRMDIDPETLCQYTGLTDKNGRKIFEGDIVKCQELKSNGNILEYASEVFWDDGCWMVHEGTYCDVELYLFDGRPNKIPLTEIEVIGNTFDNPELLSQLN